ncbi:uncharacterized protein LOC132708256 isoform X2 [Cylas formicarius]|nr:uncharacterized protein LOC132708256 isoform X2 [Cylas formicarius]
MYWGKYNANRIYRQFCIEDANIEKCAIEIYVFEKHFSDCKNKMENGNNSMCGISEETQNLKMIGKAAFPTCCDEHIMQQMVKADQVFKICDYLNDNEGASNVAKRTRRLCATTLQIINECLTNQKILESFVKGSFQNALDLHLAVLDNTYDRTTEKSIDIRPSSRSVDIQKNFRRKK